MITNDLIEYIKSELSENVSKDSIIDSLLEAGWLRSDIDEGFSNIEIKPEVKKAVDQYREIPLAGDSLSFETKIEEKNTIDIKKSVDTTFYNVSPVINKSIIETPVTDTPVLAHTLEIKEPTSNNLVIETKMESKKEELPKIWVPTIIKPVINEIKIEKKEKEKGLETYNLEIPGEVKVFTTPQINSMSDIVPRGAMISSYGEDLLSVVKKEETSTSSTNKKNWMLKLGIFIIILALVGGMVFAFVAGYIKIPGSKFSFFVVKKDPKTTLLNSFLNIATLKSYKTETNIEISSPSLSSITTGLSSGEAVTSKDKDFISIKAEGLINNINNKSVLDYVFDIKSSVLEEGLITNLKYGDGNLFFTVPRLSPILGVNAPDPVTVSTTRNQLGLIVQELPLEIQNLVKKLDIYNIISTEVPLYVKSKTARMLKEFINTFEYIDKGEEIIHGIDTTHYEITVSRSATKKFLSDIVNLFILQLSPDEKKNLDEAIGASSVSSFEIWIGKNDDNLYQIKYILNAPLSKVLRLNDSGIAGNEVKLDFMTTFYDLDVENKIVIPNGEVNMDGFIKNIQNIKIKNTVSNFKTQVTLFKNAVGSYGKSNTLGSCTAPISGSLFSPVGHSKGADTAVSSISSIMNSLLLITKGEGSCYSTSKAWALAFPLGTNRVSYYCTDSIGTTTILLAPIKNSVCSNPTIIPTIN